MDAGTLESDPVGDVLRELVKVALGGPAMLRVRDRAVAHNVRALDGWDEGNTGVLEVSDSGLSKKCSGTSASAGRVPGSLHRVHSGEDKDAFATNKGNLADVFFGRSSSAWRRRASACNCM